jgi:hypothetical protein
MYFISYFLLLFLNTYTKQESYVSVNEENYKLVFDENFSSSKLNLNNWIPYYLPQWSSREKSKPNYEIRDGNLILKITENQQPWCPEFNGDVKCSSIQTGVFAGKIGSSVGQHKFFNPSKCVVREEQTNSATFLPQYGRFEIRAKAPSSEANVVSLWMIGYEDQPEKSAELCIFEVKGWNIGKKKTKIGFGIHQFNDPNLKEEFLEEDFDIDVTQFHTYSAKWTEKTVTFYIDGKKTKEIQQSPQYPMQLMLGIYEIPEMIKNKSRQKYPNEFVIDFVKVYQDK